MILKVNFKVLLNLFLNFVNNELMRICFLNDLQLFLTLTFFKTKSALNFELFNVNEYRSAFQSAQA